MKVVIQNTRTNLFLKTPALWTESLEDATNFNTSALAAIYCQRAGIEGVHVLLNFGPRKYDLVLPMQRVPAAIGAGLNPAAAGLRLS